MTHEEAEDVHHRVLAELLGREPTEAEVAARVVSLRQRLESAKSSDLLDPHEIEDAVIVSAEEVADYVATFPAGTNVAHLLDRVAPPFSRIFVEFQGRPNILDLTAWGVLLSGERLEADESSEQEWRLDGTLIAEWTKGRPIGPVARWKVFLDPQGRSRPVRSELWTLPEGIEGKGRSDLGTFLIVPLEIPEVDEKTAYRFSSSLTDLLAPALFAVSLMHCKNVDIRPVDPPERLARKHSRKHGRALTRYYVLDIRPMRSVLDAEGEAQMKGLRHALHICRGHFKTYNEDAPLFGKHTGTYWWEAQARGKAEQGIVEKDYRIRLDQGLGREYVQADEHPDIKPTAPEHTGLDPDLGGRGLRAHNLTQNLLADAVRSAGHEPRRPTPDEPQYDLAWEAGDVTWVAEVKSITPRNEERQLRTALGQVLRYRQLLEEEGRTVKAMIATEMKPTDPSWETLLAEENVVLVWPGQMKIKAD